MARARNEPRSVDQVLADLDAWFVARLLRCGDLNLMLRKAREAQGAIGGCEAYGHQPTARRWHSYAAVRWRDVANAAMRLAEWNETRMAKLPER